MLVLQQKAGSDRKPSKIEVSEPCQQTGAQLHRNKQILHFLHGAENMHKINSFVFQHASCRKQLFSRRTTMAFVTFFTPVCVCVCRATNAFQSPHQNKKASNFTFPQKPQSCRSSLVALRRNLGTPEKGFETQRQDHPF